MQHLCWHHKLSEKIKKYIFQLEKGTREAPSEGLLQCPSQKPSTSTRICVRLIKQWDMGIFYVKFQGFLNSSFRFSPWWAIWVPDPCSFRVLDCSTILWHPIAPSLFKILEKPLSREFIMLKISGRILKNHFHLQNKPNHFLDQSRPTSLLPLVVTIKFAAKQISQF
jgi:hypothetical protein